MGKAISKVFPGTRHRLCLWHIMRKFPEKLSHVYHEHSAFKYEFNNLINHSKSIEQFEEQWGLLLYHYGLEDNEWLKGLYQIRNSWIPIFNNRYFWAGMKTTQRSESINAFFNTFLHSGMTLREFVTKYDTAVDSRYESYKKEEFDSVHKERKLSLNTAIEEHASDVYTRNVFVEFYTELAASITLLRDKMFKEGTCVTYRLWDRKEVGNDHVVQVDGVDATCTCLKFEFKGILCRHILNIFHAKSLTTIPDRYVLQRWRKDGNKIVFHTERQSCVDGVLLALRSLELQDKYVRMSAFADQSDNAYRFIDAAIDTILSTAADIAKNDSDNVDVCGTQVGSNTAASLADSTLMLKDPQVSQTKGRKRAKSGVETATKNTNICGKCGKRGHNRRGCKQTSKAV